MIRYSLFILTIFGSLLWGQASIAQSLAPAQQSDSEEKITVESVVAYLASEKVAAAGVGFRDIQLGDLMSSLQKRWGPPDVVKEKKLSSKKAFYYQTDPNTVVGFSGKETIDNISVQGNHASLFRTNRGLRFGMRSINVARMYSQFEAKSKKNRVDYKKAGIRFFLTNDRLVKVEIFKPKTGSFFN